MALLSHQPVQPSGLAASYVAASAGGDTFPPGNHVFLHVRTGGTATNVTVASPTPCSQGFTHDLVVAVGTSSDRMIGPLTEQRFANGSGMVTVTYSATTAVTVAVVRI